uniref:hypothetical protein n=1 Tax=uncultured Sphingomonas sp. TaxID=158754 RepID=UPI0035CAD797
MPNNHRDGHDVKSDARHRALREIALSAKERAHIIALASAARAQRSRKRVERAQAMVERTTDRLHVGNDVKN